MEENQWEKLPPWTDEEFERFTRRLQTFKENPLRMRPDEFNKCRALHREIETDSVLLDRLIAAGTDLSSVESCNPKRAALAEWLARTP